MKETTKVEEAVPMKEAVEPVVQPMGDTLTSFDQLEQITQQNLIDAGHDPEPEKKLIEEANKDEKPKPKKKSKAENDASCPNCHGCMA